MRVPSITDLFVSIDFDITPPNITTKIGNMSKSINKLASNIATLNADLSAAPALLAPLANATIDVTPFDELLQRVQGISAAIQSIQSINSASFDAMLQSFTEIELVASNIQGRLWTSINMIATLASKSVVIPVGINMQQANLDIQALSAQLSATVITLQAEVNSIVIHNAVRDRIAGQPWSIMSRFYNAEVYALHDVGNAVKNRIDKLMGGFSDAEVDNITFKKPVWDEIDRFLESFKNIDVTIGAIAPVTVDAILDISDVVAKEQIRDFRAFTEEFFKDPILMHVIPLDLSGNIHFQNPAGLVPIQGGEIPTGIIPPSMPPTRAPPSAGNAPYIHIEIHDNYVTEESWIEKVAEKIKGDLSSFMQGGQP